ncbi:septum formation initiator family protein [uncultured Phascolarctobacterium sp.]|uniref:FtsB family cell division protein n=1 Tax=uncultured Phascolarctobacterium sp. TaxID=512296 RepID=UPI0025EA38AA|nr:septum formation initiator family protein [uncultured Phascolarctobacterium sp.]
MSRSRRRKRRTSAFKLFMLLVLIVCAAVVGRQEYSIYQIKREQAATQQRIDSLKQQKAALEQERKRLDDPRYIEKLAREDYNMVGKNEVPLFIVEEQKQAEQK